ncbi:MAG: hypothetical protein DHS20C01_11420 [marine bacterium B5-7]|nr:MAG: hypothetical protein DHS20C01_11420 [marine bacterium B5-7]
MTAIKAGKVELNAHKAKPSKLVKVGDRLKIRRERFIFEVDVLALNDKRLGAVAAQALYREQDMSRERREKLIMEMAAERKSVRFADGRPGKRDRRVLEQFKREGYKP